MFNQAPATVSVVIKGGMVADTFANRDGVQVRIYDYDAVAVEGDAGAAQVYDAEIAHFTPQQTTCVEVGEGVPQGSLATPVLSSKVLLEASLIFVGMVKLLDQKYSHITSSTVITYGEFVLGLNRLSMTLAITADALIDREVNAKAPKPFVEQCCTYLGGEHTPFIGSICYGQFCNMDWVQLIHADTVPGWLTSAVSDWLDIHIIAKK